MFDNKRYITAGIDKEIPLPIQILMWGMIDDVKKHKKRLITYKYFILLYVTVTLKSDNTAINRTIIKRIHSAMPTVLKNTVKIGMSG